MTTTLRIDDALKQECDSVLDDIGLNLSCAITIFLKELTRRRAMPFAVRASNAEGYVVADPPIATTRGSLSQRYLEKMRNEGAKLAENRAAFGEAFCKLRERGQIAKRFFAEMREESAEDMTLDEINAEIAAARAERHAREKNLS